MHSIEIIIYCLFLGQGLSIYIEFPSVAKPYLYMYNVIYQVNIKSSAMYSFIVFKYVHLILWKEQYTLGRIGLYFGGFGEKLN